MKLILFVIVIVIVVLVLFFVYFATDTFAKQPESVASQNVPVLEKSEDAGIEIQLIRHSTLIITADDKKILVDPMFGDVGTESPYPLTANRVKNPLIPLPVDKESLVKDVDAVLLTHNHPDHFDQEAINALPKDTLIFCQPGDDLMLKENGFTNVQVVDSEAALGELSITRFPANHGEGIWREQMGQSSSYYIQTKEASLFITGDAILDELLESSLKETGADLIVANAGSAQFLVGKPITLTSEALKRITELLPDAKIIADHMDAINHCGLTKDDLRTFLAEENLTDRIYVPNEGDILSSNDM